MVAMMIMVMVMMRMVVVVMRMRMVIMIGKLRTLIVTMNNVILNKQMAAVCSGAQSYRVSAPGTSQIGSHPSMFQLF